MKRYTMDFEGFGLNESQKRWFEKDWLDYDLAFITMNALADAKTPFNQRVYMSLFERDQIRKKYGKRLPRGFAGPDRHMMPGSIIGPLVDDVVYTDDADLVKGDQTIFVWPNTTWDDVRTMLQTKFGVLTKRGMKARNLFGV